MSDASGLVSGRFRLGELLGTGGSASVFAAFDTHTGAAVALKILHPHLSERPVARDAFVAEARRVEPLRHPNIVAVRGAGVDETADPPLVWIALERAEGMTLSEHVAQHGPLPVADAVAVADGVLRALEAAHEIGLVHRDVSPSNVMVSRRSAGSSIAPAGIDGDSVRLLDFGMADAAGEAAWGTDDLLSTEPTGRPGVIGNVNYLSPEQARGEPVDARGDVYQSGAVLYFALTGRPPFPRETTGQTMRAHLESPPPVPSVVDPRIPRGLDRIVVRAMLKDPADRFTSATEMRAALTQLHAAPDAQVTARHTIAIAVAAVAPPIATVSSPVAAATQAVAASVPRLPAPRPVEVPTVTRVLGRTVVPPREHGAPSALHDAHTASGRPRRVRPRVGTWIAATTAALVATTIVVLAAASSPTASIERAPTTAATAVETPVPAESAPVPQPEADVVPVAQPAVPDLAHHSIGEAERALADAGLVAGEVRRVDSPLAADTVLESSPAAGSRLAAGTVVALIVASGWNTIPDVTGQGRDAAAAIVQSSGFAPSFAYRTAPAGTPAGAILGTDPQAGTIFAVGTPITILEALATTSTPTPTPTTPAPTSSPTPSLGAGG